MKLETVGAVQRAVHWPIVYNVTKQRNRLFTALQFHLTLSAVHFNQSSGTKTSVFSNALQRDLWEWETATVSHTAKQPQLKLPL